MEWLDHIGNYSVASAVRAMTPFEGVAMIRHSLTNAARDHDPALPGRRRALQLLLGMPLMFAATAIVGCAETNSVGSSRPKSYITGNGGADGKSKGGQ